MELKYAGPARSKKLIGSTTPSSRATAPKWRTAGSSVTVCASPRWRASCSMQKYGGSNSSGSRMTCAPCAAAFRTSCSARLMLPRVSQSQDICSAATVTGRGGRRKCSGSFDIAHLIDRPRGPSPSTSSSGFAGRERLVHLGRNPHRGLERREPGFPRHHRRAAGTDAVEKGVDLGLERISLIEALLLDADRQ